LSSLMGDRLIGGTASDDRTQHGDLD
jgi:hypothetical protein